MYVCMVVIDVVKNLKKKINQEDLQNLVVCGGGGDLHNGTPPLLLLLSFVSLLLLFPSKKIVACP